MTDTVRAVVALDSHVDRAVVEALMLDSKQMDVLDYVEIAGAEHRTQSPGDVLVVACQQYTVGVGEYVADASRLYPARPVVLMCPTMGNGYVSQAFAAGVDDIVALPRESDAETARTMATQVAFTLEKAVARRRGVPLATTGKKQAEVICVLGLKGGSGKTLTVANLACALADAGQRVAIVDLDFQFGDVGLALGLSPERTVYDLIRSGGSIDREKLDDFLATHQSGVRALLAPARPDEAGIVTAEFMRDSVYPLLREMFDFVVIDTPPSFTATVIGAVDISTEICVVAMLDALSLKNTRLGLETLDLMDQDIGRVKLVLNRADSNVGISRDDVVAVLGREPDVLVPSDRNVVRSINAGEPIALAHKRADAARSFHALARLYLTEADLASTAVDKPRRRRRLFQRKG
jgi:pilus assembly protein CpaE